MRRPQAATVPCPPPPRAFPRSANRTSPTPGARRRRPRSAKSSRGKEGTSLARHSRESTDRIEHSAASDPFPLPAIQLVHEIHARHSGLGRQSLPVAQTNAPPPLVDPLSRLHARFAHRVADCRQAARLYAQKQLRL